MLTLGKSSLSQFPVSKAHLKLFTPGALAVNSMQGSELTILFSNYASSVQEGGCAGRSQVDTQ